MDKAIIKSEDGKCHYFYDDPDWDEPYWQNMIITRGVVGKVDIDAAVGKHSCIRSALYEDLTNYVDEIQHEEELPDRELYVVSYYKANGSDTELEQLVDYGLTKQQVIDNVKAQRYVEGADYFLLTQLIPLGEAVRA